MEREIEIKYDLEGQSSELEQNIELLIEKNYKILSKRDIERKIEYYDTRDFKLYHKGDTLRRVSGFENGMCEYRYDFKKGSIEKRLEQSFWCNKILCGAYIISHFYLNDYVENIIEIATVDTKHHKFDFTDGKSIVEGTFDHYFCTNGKEIKEVEFELKKGDESILEEIHNKIYESFKLEKSNKQKYSRIVRTLYSKLLS
ncbi:hypothetical protein KY334_00845 [Candidatus Woesearchaeota archaeon]|nr:hypothetical protein [Candidatus Woesearchaeota archaeon]